MPPILTDSSSPAAPSIAILGADLVVAAAPAPLARLVAAVEQLGFDAVAPASWGDEVIAEATVKYLARRGDEPVTICSCPYARKLLADSPRLEQNCLDLVSPPVATARYIRALYAGARVRITYLGDCPSAYDSSIDDVRRVESVLYELHARNLLATERAAAQSPLGHRRYRSLPGGLPHATALRECGGREVLHIDGSDPASQIERRVSERQPVLMDLSSAVGCSCAGALAPGEGETGRARLCTVEPTRAKGEVLSPTVRPDVLRTRSTSGNRRGMQGGFDHSTSATIEREIELPTVQLGAPTSTMKEARTEGVQAAMIGAYGAFMSAHFDRQSEEFPNGLSGNARPPDPAGDGSSLPSRSLGKEKDVSEVEAERPVALEQVSHGDQPTRRRTSLGGLTIQLPEIEPYRVPPPPLRSDTLLRIAGTAVLILALVLAILIIT